MKKILALILIVVILFAPVFQIMYFEEEVGLVLKTQSIVRILAEDIQNGTLGTGK